MLKYYLDKTGKVIKSILFPSSEFVDTEPREGSMNPVTSGGVAGSVSQQSSNFAPNYTKKTYEANSYVMQGGVLYTNPNAIGTAEDWNPAHWTQTTVAEMVAGAGGGYKEVNLTFGKNDTKTIPVGQKEDVYVECTVKASDNLVIQLAADCTDAVIRLKRLNSTRFHSFAVKRGNDTVPIYGDRIVTDISTSALDGSYQVLLTSKFEEDDHGTVIPSLPTDFSEIELNSSPIIDDVNVRNVGYDLTVANTVNTWLFVVKGRNVMCLPN